MISSKQIQLIHSGVFATLFRTVAFSGLAMIFMLSSLHPAEAGGRGNILTGVGVGLGLGIILNEAAKSKQRPRKAPRN